MAKKGKKYQEAVKLVDKNKVYEVAEGIELVKKAATAKFDETVEAAFRLGVDPKRADQQIRALLYCLMVLVKYNAFSYSLKAKKQKMRKQLAQTS